MNRFLKCKYRPVLFSYLQTVLKVKLEPVFFFSFRVFFFFLNNSGCWENGKLENVSSELKFMIPFVMDLLKKQ